MIFGTGIDIIEVSRVAERISNPAFVTKVFSAAETEFCTGKADMNQHFAVRFAAKEAFLKATGCGLTAGFDLCEIEVINDHVGKPELRLSGKFMQLAHEGGWKQIHVSLSHVKEMACAIVIIEK